MPAAEAFRAIARSCLRQIIANEPAMCAGRAEGLHQMRIGLRRLRACHRRSLPMWSAARIEEKIKTELKWITQELGPARDLDVFAADVLEPLRAAHPSDAGLALTHRNFEAKRKEAYRPRRHRRSLRPLPRRRCSTLSRGSRRATGARPAASTARRCRARAVAEHAKAELTKLRKRIKRKGCRLAPSERQATPQIAHPRQAAALRDRVLRRHVSGGGRAPSGDRTRSPR